MSPIEFEYLINLVGKQISKIDTTYRIVIPFQKRLAITLRSLDEATRLNRVRISGSVSVHTDCIRISYHFFDVSAKYRLQMDHGRIVSAYYFDTQIRYADVIRRTVHTKLIVIRDHDTIR
ncbi:hypothetical protein X777_15020 [Ooceraea biroi]|uniref:Uncharacterized protein n=1 Tax=Ooceraea biroi TaxID=2015173 RepID=A0A026WT43_OOCBI|nr:hypothetical protein X777_15020 [Ooceraea biroi]